jgi:HlyD family secretion protein
MQISPRQRTVLLWSLLIVGGAALLTWGLWPTPREVEVVAVTRQAIEVQRVDQGYAQVRDLYRVSAPVSGQLQRVTLEPGDAVEAGALLAQLRPIASTPLDSRSAAEADAAVAVARAQLAQTEAALASARDLLQRNQALQARGLIAERDLAQSRSTEREAAAAVAAALAALQQAQARVDWETAPSGQLLELRAPTDGQVLRVLRESEGPVAAGEALLELGDPSRLEVVAEFLSQEAADVQPGARSQIEAWGGEPLAATVRRVEPLGELKISALGVEERRVRILLDLDSAPATLGHGYQVDVRITVQRREAALAVPLEALVREATGWAVWRLREGTVERVAVSVGVTDGRVREVLDGLQEDDAVVLYPPPGLISGQTVRQLPPSSR